MIADPRRAQAEQETVVDRTLPGTLMGSPAYMSPEQARGDSIDGRSDVFSIGVVAWELLARRHLFMRAQPYLTLTAVVEDEVPALEGAPPALEAAIRRALAKDPADRWPTAAALGAELSNLARADAHQ